MVKAFNMMILSEILSSKMRAEIFRLLFGVADKELHVREIERQSGLTLGTVRQELKKLSEMDLVKARREGNRLYYRANEEHPLFNDIRNIVLKTSGLVEVLREALDRKEVKVAFVFGSIARKDEGARSDVDLMVIGDVSLRKAVGWLSSVAERVGREINPHAFSVGEFQKRKESGDHFLTTVLNSPKLFIKGDNHALAAVGRQQVASDVHDEFRGDL
jgi:DNA-binding transcriptional ArsR family regulator